MKGYPGHEAGSRKEQVRRVFDLGGRAAARAFGLRTGLKAGTLSTWFSLWSRQTGRTWSVQDAKNQFSSLMNAAQREPQTVTRHGKAAVVIVDAGEFSRLQMSGRSKASTFVEHLLSVPQSADADTLERMPGGLRDIDL